jgi:hypothetical protein
LVVSRKPAPEIQLHIERLVLDEALPGRRELVAAELIATLERQLVSVGLADWVSDGVVIDRLSAPEIPATAQPGSGSGRVIGEAVAATLTPARTL